jgi:aspartate aminotransferase
MEVVRYRYFDKKTVGLDFEGMKEDIKVSDLSLLPSRE